MESDKKYTLTVFNTCTREYEEVAVTEEVYRTYYRTGWNIKDNNQRFFDNEIQMSGMIGSQDGAYENFREFVDTINTPENIALEQMMIEALYQAIAALSAEEQALVQGLILKGMTEREYAEQENKKIYRKLALRAVQNEDFFPYTSEKEMFLTCTLQIEYPIV